MNLTKKLGSDFLSEYNSVKGPRPKGSRSFYSYLTHYVFQGTEPIFEKKISAGTAKSYVYALGKYLARVDGVIGDSEAKKYFYHTDHAGSIRVITDQAGKVVYNADYLAFGSQYIKEGDFEELHGFTGKEYDPDVGLYYFNARWYDPDLGRFISEDPAADPNNPNLYSYCGNNPLNRVDPTGKVWWWLVSAILSGLDSYLCGGDFMQGFVMGAVTGAIGAGVNTFVSSVWGNTLGAFGSQIVSGAIAGGITGELSGEGFKKGAVYGAVAGAISYGVDMRYGEYANKSTYNKVVINGLKGGLNGLARGGDFIEGFAYGFAYGYAYELGANLFSNQPSNNIDLIRYLEKELDVQISELDIQKASLTSDNNGQDNYKVALKLVTASGQIISGYMNVRNGVITILADPSKLSAALGIGQITYGGYKIINGVRTIIVSTHTL